MSHPLTIIHEDAHCLAVNKPPGQFPIGTWAPEGEMTLETTVRRHLNHSDPGAVYLGIVHRLDRPTSGVLIWAKTPKAARRLSSQFEHRKVTKEYWAVIECAAEEQATAEETWTDWLTRPDSAGIVHVVDPGTSGAREATTRIRYQPAPSLPGGLSWLRLWPYTGRTHQLRIQSSSRGRPIVGDREYHAATCPPGLRGIALHARFLTLNHPVTGAQLHAKRGSTFRVA